MEHAREIELIELAARRLDPVREKALLMHLQGCSDCRIRLEGFRHTWEILGAWQVQPAGSVDLTRLTASHASPERASARSVIRFPGMGAAVRIAASIAVAILVGYAGGRWSTGPAQTVSGVQPPQYISVLGLEVGESLSPLVLQNGLFSGQEG
jgi:hypothetical protein